jgi:hypothetical protein
MVGEFMMNSTGKRGMGWIPDYPDFRDYTEKTEEVKSVLETTRVLKARGLPGSMDLSSGVHP